MRAAPAQIGFKPYAMSFFLDAIAIYSFRMLFLVSVFPYMIADALCKQVIRRDRQVQEVHTMPVKDGTCVGWLLWAGC